jgi:hypothetical protein
MIKSDMGNVEIEGLGKEILAEFGVLYKAMREDFEKEDIMNVINYIEKRIEKKEKLIEGLKKLID